MKRVLAWILCIILVLSLVLTGVFVADAAQLDANGPLYAGYSKVRIDPSGHPDGPISNLPMSGYSTSTDRLSSGGMDDTGDGRTNEKDGLFATCVAITDQYGKTIIYYGLDIINPNTTWTNPARTVILAALEEAGYKLDNGDLYMSASHTHNGPDLTYGISFSESKLAGDPIAQRTKKYRDWVFALLGQMAVDAMEDREEVTLTKGTVDVSDAIKAMNPKATANQQRLNYVRHYKIKSGNTYLYGGSNFGYTNYNSENTHMVMEPVDLMHLVQLTPKSGDKDPIVMVNWDAHATINSTGLSAYGLKYRYKMSSDWVNSMRYGLEAAGYRATFSQGTAGNKVPTTAVKSLQNPDVQINGEERGYLYGARVADVALYGLKNCMGKPLDTSRIRNATARFDFKTNAPTPEEAALVTAMLAADPSTYPSDKYADLISYLAHEDTWPKRTQYYAAFPYLRNINSRYQLSNIKSRMSYLTTEESSITVGVLSIGKELSFVVSPNELADRYSATDTLSSIKDNDWDDLIDDTYGRPLVMGYTNDGAGYIPHQLAYTYNEGSTSYAIGSYESQVARYGRYTGEQLVAFFDGLLDTVNTSEARYQCACGGKAVNGENGHTCEIVEFLPWNMDDSLPTGGNYYLTKDVVTTYQVDISNSTLRLDLNGHDITFKVPESQGAKAEAKQTHYTRVLCVNAASHLYLTDSTANPGTISRDLSELTETQKSKITNYGLIVSIYGTGKMTMFGGIMDATGTVTGGGGCLCVYNQTSEFTMYGGLMKGTKSSNGGVVYNRGSMYLYGGELTGGTTSANSGTPGITNTSESGSTIKANVTIGGTARVWGNTWANGTQVNIGLPSNPEVNFKVKGNFTGKVGLYTSSPTDGKVVGVADNATIAAGSLVMDRYPDYRIEIKDNQLVLNSEVQRCECGGTLTGKTAYGHTCKNITWKAWRTTSSLPTEGNYYLAADVTVTSQQTVKKALRLDLNGHSITHKVSSSQGTKAAAGETHSTRVFHMAAGSSLVITDSTEKPGTVKRDLSSLTAAQRAAITNRGLMVLIDNIADTGNFTLYNGILDAQGANTNGGVIANINTMGSAINIYGGTITGGNGGGIYGKGPVNIHGGTITGNKSVTGGGVYMTGSTASLLLTGGANISGNAGNGGKTVSNVWTDSKVTVDGTFTGTVGFTVDKPADGVKVADGKNANISAATLTVDANPNYAVVLSGNALVLKPVNNKVMILSGGREQGFENLAKAVAAYPGGEAVIKLLTDNAEAVAFPANTNLDLNGFDLTGKVTQKGTLFVKDSATDDYTTNDAQGCGTVPNTLTDVQPMPGYLMETKTKGYAFHCLNLDTVAVTLNPSQMGLYFQSQFGGDEYIKSVVKSYGVALGAGKEPRFADGTYTVYDGATWTVGTDKDGNANNLGQGTLLKDILQTTNSKEDNETYAVMQIYGRAYVELTDGTRYVGNMICLSMKEVLMGNDEMLGADGLWKNLDKTQQKSLVEMYTAYYNIMSVSSWKLPNIKAAYAEANK